MLSTGCQSDLQVGTQFPDEGEDHETRGEEKRGDVLPPSEICCLTFVSRVTRGVDLTKHVQPCHFLCPLF